MNSAYINKLTSKEQQAHEESRDGTFTPLRDGGVLLRCGTRTKNLTGEDAIRFFNSVRGVSEAHSKSIVKGYF